MPWQSLRKAAVRVIIDAGGLEGRSTVNIDSEDLPAKGCQ